MVQQQQVLYRAEKEQKNDHPVRELAAKKAFEALPGVQSVRARAENDARDVLLPFCFINFVRIFAF